MPVPITQFLAHLDIDSKNLGFISHISENHPQIHSYVSGFYIMNVRSKPFLVCSSFVCLPWMNSLTGTFAVNNVLYTSLFLLEQDMSQVFIHPNGWLEIGFGDGQLINSELKIVDIVLK